MRSPIVICAVTAVAVAAAVAPTASAAPATPQTWMSATCASLTSLQSGITAITRDQVTSRPHTLAALKAIGASTDTLVATTSKPMPKTPHGAAVALALHTAAGTLRRSLSAGQASVTKVDSTRVSAQTAKVAAALHTLSAKLGAVFVHLDLRFSSPVLDATIDQTPSCELVHR